MTISPFDADSEFGSSNFKKESDLFSLNPQESHIFGGDSIAISLFGNKEIFDDDSQFFVVFKGSNLYHITSSKVYSHAILQAIIPYHDCAEVVEVSVLHLKVSENITSEIFKKTFTFHEDSVNIMAKELIENAFNSDGLFKLQGTYSKELKMLGRDKNILDSKLVDSLMKLSFPTLWGTGDTGRTYDTGRTENTNQSQWTLLHFCAKYRLPLMAEYLLTKNGANKVLKVTDSKGRTPLDIACKIKHSKLIELFSRKPCESDYIDKVELNVNRPVVKRHKIGTITITNKIPESKEIDIDRGLMLLKELDLLSANASENLQKFDDSDEKSPLAESLMKLQEINAEIRRLRSLSYKEIEDESEGVISDSDEDINGKSVLDSNKALDTDISIKEDSKIVLSDIEDEIEKNYLPKRRLSNVIVGFIEQPHITEVAEVVPTLFKEIEVLPCAMEEVINKNLTNDNSNSKNSDNQLNSEDLTAKTKSFLPPENNILSDESESLSSGSSENLSDVKTDDLNNLQELNFKLESVLEETEDDLNDDILHKQLKSTMHLPKNGSDSSLDTSNQILLKKMPAIRRHYTESKNDRPLSDSFENLRKVEKEGLFELFQQDPNLDKKEIVKRVLSLDQLTNNNAKSNADDFVDRQSHTSLNKESQNSLNTNDSESSLVSDAEQQAYRQRSDSNKSTTVMGSFLSTSTYSLNDAQLYGASLGHDLNNGKFPKKPSLLSKISFKKAKSMTSLSEDNSTGADVKKSELDVVRPNKAASFILNEKDLKKSQSTVSINSVMKEPLNKRDSRRLSTTDIPISRIKLSEDTDEDTDEGTSIRIENDGKRKTSDDRSKRIFGIISTNRKIEKDKKVLKEKKIKNQKDRKDSDPKVKGLPIKLPIKLETKSDKLSGSFLRGNSFRTTKAVTLDSKTNAENHKAMFMRNPKDGSNKLRGSDRKPVVPQKSSSVESEIDVNIENTNDIPSILSQNLSRSRSPSESDESSIHDDTDFNASSCQENAYDSDLDAKDEPETWSELVDKKVQRKMQAKDIKRQDVIYELIQTEAVYVRVLYIMRKIYAHGMTEVLRMDHSVVDSIFPGLNELIELNGSFLNKLKERQQSSPNYCIENIGDILIDFFGEENSEMLKKTYGYFCSHHAEALSTYKEILKNDRIFAAYMRNCMLNKRTRRLSIPECITYVTIRITKYPLLIEAIMKATKESKPGYDTLKIALNLSKEFLVAVDESVNAYEQQKVLEVLRKSVDKRSVVEIKKMDGGKSTFYANKLFTRRSRLMYDKKCVLRGKSKNYDTRMVVLADKLIFLTDNGGKLQLLSIDNRPPCLSLKSLMVREVATDNKALFLVSNGEHGAQMYEVVCDSYKDKKEFMPKLQSYIKNCPDEGDNTTDEEEIKKEEAERMEKLLEYIEQLQSADEKINKIFSEKNKFLSNLRELLETMDESGVLKGPPCISVKRVDIENARETLENCLSEVNALASMICSYNVDLTVTSPSPSPINNSTNSLNNSTHLPRSETFTAAERVKSVSTSSNINRIYSLKPHNRTVNSVVEDSKPRRQSQLLSALSRGTNQKVMGSSEDLTSVASSVSLSSLSTVTSALSQVSLFQSLKDHLNSLVDVTTKQDLEVAKMRFDLQESRSENVRLVEERKQLEEKLTQQQKDSERQLRYENEKYLKLTREFKRNNDRLNKQMEEKKNQYQQLLDAYNALNKHSGELSHQADDNQKASDDVLYF
ncbi:A-kinase anchor protein 13 isoform X2 [Hydra vulgaris]|uniref:A-kinase anchor protein 13 isoform X2 n=2 Tax=Hydra vulgaris TaxID=6087 RepID=A0ABM4DEE7_HYDVU